MTGPRKSDLGEFDGIIDRFVHDIGQEDDPLEIKLEEVLQKAFGGNILDFAYSLARGVERCGCENCMFVTTCVTLKGNIDEWSNRLLAIEHCAHQHHH